MVGRGGDYFLIDENRMFDFLKEVVSAAGMKILGGPVIYRGNIDLPGITGSVIIETSHINIHTFSRTGDIRFDLYSCVSFSKEEILKIFGRYYPSEVVDIQTPQRMPILTSDYSARREPDA